MAYADTIKTVLDADATLVAILTGGIYVKAKLKKAGINDTDTPAAYNASGTLKPILVLVERDSLPWGGLADPANQYQSDRTIIEFYFHDDADAGYTAIESARDRVRVLLHDKRASGIFSMRRVNKVNNLRDRPLGNAPTVRDDYQVIGREFTP